jgi:hypothetical protein
MYSNGGESVDVRAARQPRCQAGDDLIHPCCTPVMGAFTLRPAGLSLRLCQLLLQPLAGALVYQRYALVGAAGNPAGTLPGGLQKGIGFMLALLDGTRGVFFSGQHPVHGRFCRLGRLFPVLFAHASASPLHAPAKVAGC